MSSECPDREIGACHVLLDVTQLNSFPVSFPEVIRTP